MIRGAANVRDAYRVDAIARTYVDERFVQPLGAMLHDRQVDAVCTLIGQERPCRILELAPGPARLTSDIARRSRRRIVMVDTSLQMLTEARRRLTADSHWSAVQGNAFSLPFAGPFDLVYSFRLIRHFESADRERLYTEIRRILRPGGHLVFDAVNEVVSAPLRAASPSEYSHYDALLSPAMLRDELERGGFRLTALNGVQHRYSLLARLQVLVSPRSKTLARFLMERVDRLGGEPLEWVVVCRRR